LCTDISEHMENYLVKKEVLSEKNLIWFHSLVLICEPYFIKIISMIYIKILKLQTFILKI
jgi:hypothetical protein